MNTISLPKEKNLRLLVNLATIYFYMFTALIMSYFLTGQNLKTSLFYCSVVLVSVAFAILAELTMKNKMLYTFFMFLSFFVLFFIYGFREFSAIDDPSYIRIFEQVSTVGIVEYFKFSTMEPGYLLLNFIVSKFTSNYLYLQIITSFIPIAVFYYGFNKYRKIISLPMAVFLLCSMLYFQMLSVALVRMFISISIIFVAFRHIPEKSTKKYAFMVLVATVFHYSSFIMIILAYFSINKSAISKRATKIYTATFFASPFIFIFIARFIVPLLGIRYTQYATIDGIDIGFSTFSTIPFIIILIYFINKFEGLDKLYFKFFIFVYSLSIIISLFGGIIGLGRLVFYSYAAFILGASMISKKMSLTSVKMLYSFIIIFYGFLYIFYTQFINEPHIPHLYPYKNIFFTF